MASTAFVHPVIRTLDPDNQLLFEKGLLKTFGRAVPIGMTLGVIPGIALAIHHTNYFTISAAIALVVALIVTIFGNVPINAQTGRITETTATKSPSPCAGGGTNTNCSAQVSGPLVLCY